MTDKIRPIQDCRVSRQYRGLRIPVLSPSGDVLMPTTSTRARKWIASGKAKPVWNDLNIFCVQLLVKPSGTDTQKIVASIDPGKLFSGIAAVSKKALLFTAHVVLLFKRVIARKQAQKILRRSRRGRRINRNIPFAQRAHREKRFANRRGNKLPPSIRANRQLELRIVQELTKLFPITEIVYEYVKARGDKGFSPVMVGQKWMIDQLSKIATTHPLEGWKTSILRKHLGLEKNKDDKSVQNVTTHGNDAIALAASRFIQYKAFHTANSQGRHWVGSIQLTDAPFKVIARPELYRRQLHFENKSKSGVRKRKGKRIGYPRFKKKHNQQSARFRKGGFSIKGDKVYLAKIGLLRTKWSRELPSEPSSVTVIKDRANRYFLSFVVEIKPEIIPVRNESIGIDLGVKIFAALSTQEKIYAPDYSKLERKIRRIKRVLS